MSSHQFVFLVLSSILLWVPVGGAAQPIGEVPSSPSDSTTSAVDSSDAVHQSQALSRFPALNTLGVWFAGSLSTGRVFGTISRARFGLLGLRYHRRLTPQGPNSPPSGPTFTYTADLFPAVLLSIPPSSLPPPDEKQDPEQPPSIRPNHLTAYGFGGSPFGIRITPRAPPRLQPFIAGSIGIVYFSQRVPDERGTHLNFTFDVGMGVEAYLTTSATLILGYRYHHLSNGFRGTINPGIDAHLLYLGFTLMR